ncbi:MAG: glycoside hydrolase family 2 TIM barrel-domain containing protein, partial [Nanoarchaeota archaeon]
MNDEGFESDAANAQFPSSGLWTSSWVPAQSGAIVTTTAAHSGSNGLWTYTAQTTQWAWTGTYQQVNANPGDIFSASAYIKTPPPGTYVDWVDGSFACVRIEFLNSVGTPISYQDSNKLTTGNTGWQSYSLTTDPAPIGTTKVRYRAYLEKPASTSRQSVANFDDCYLEKTGEAPQTPQIYMNKYSVGIRKGIIDESFKIKNIQTGSLHYELSENLDWLSLSQTTGDLDAQQENEITLTANRAFCSMDTCSGNISVITNAGNKTIKVYLEVNTTVPFQPSIVDVEGSRLVVRKRLMDGSLDMPQFYIIKGTGWTPSSIGTPTDYWNRRNEFKKWYVADVQLMKEMGVNTVYVFLDFFANPDAISILDYLYLNGIMVIMTADEDGANNLANIDSIVPYYKDHPAILMWAIGNEWNINFYHGKYSTLDQSAVATEIAAQRIKNLDSGHPVASIYGEINILPPQPLSKTQDIVNNIAPSVDIWGVNIYRGDTFGTLFDQWSSITSKPMFLSEYGTDSYYTTSFYPAVGYEDEAVQAEFNHKLWQNIKNNLSAYNESNVCLGGTVFESSDEWWKVKSADGGNISIHDNGGFDTPWNPYAHPDGFGNEEYFGIMQIERKPKQSYYQYKEDFFNITDIGCRVDGDCDDTLYCNGIETCVDNLCQAGTTVNCNDEVSCTEDLCNEDTDSCDNVVNNANCDDGLFCNGFETCHATLDCQAGTAPATNDNVDCTDDSCDEVNDVIVNTANNANCDDGLFCNGFETCHATLDCQAGTAPATDDNVDCTDDSCDEVNDIVVNTANDGNCNDGVICSIDICDILNDCQHDYSACFCLVDGDCIHMIDQCNTGICNAQLECEKEVTNEGLVCDDGVYCNIGETCQAGTCIGGIARDCSDGVGCTDDSCDEVNDVIVNAANNANCDDGLFCNGAETCNALTDCQAG